MADPILEIADSARSQTERDLGTHATDKCCRAIYDAWELIDDPAARARIAVLVATAAMGAAAASMQDAKARLGGIVPGDRDMYVAILKTLADNVPQALSNDRSIRPTGRP